jgi:hypothetical protein
MCLREAAIRTRGVADDVIIAQVEAEHPLLRGVRFHAAPE